MFKIGDKDYILYWLNCKSSHTYMRSLHGQYRLLNRVLLVFIDLARKFL